MRRTSSSACVSRIRSETSHCSEVIVDDSCSAGSRAVPCASPHLTIAHPTEQVHAVGRRMLAYFSRRHDAVLVEGLRERQWDVRCAKSSRELLRLVKANHAHVGIVDFGGCRLDDVVALESSLRHPQIGWMALVNNASLAISDIRKLIRRYCFDYFNEPPTPATIDILVDHAYRMVALSGLEPEADVTPIRNDEMVGTCEAMQQLFRTIRKVANTEASVFISGESGTGKELTALAIHERSTRRKAPFVAINCGAIPHHLLQSELFGYERGAFTGANQRKIGRVEAAHGGTLFLDEIGDMPIDSQASMLRFLQEGRIERLGGRESIPVDVRILSATHVDLEAAMRAGRFREDLFHRLCVLRIDEPPLRVRGKDIELLANHMLQRFRSDGASNIRGFSPCAIDAMHSYAWPGNVRELINRIRRAIVMADGRLISAADLDLGQYTSRQLTTLAEAREYAQKSAIEAALLHHRRNLTETARALDISRTTLYRLIEEYGL
ncbi:sigma-54-dependent transcriptional regulator [Burkholderia ubonensis]